MIVLDTNVMSESMRLVPSPHVMTWIERHDRQIHIPAIAIAEVAFGIHKVPPEQQSPRWLRRIGEWRQRYANRILAFDIEAADIYGRIMGRAHLGGRPAQPLDGMIAAIALRHGGIVATRNVAHFGLDGVTVTNPWLPQV
jgi:predicted nucleic acid-binding protein